MSINVEWHKQNRMIKNATIEQRIEWHMLHKNNCQCRKDFPKKLAEEMKKRGIDPNF